MAILHKIYGFDFEIVYRDFRGNSQRTDLPLDTLKNRARAACRDKTAECESFIHMLGIDEKDADDVDTYLLALSGYFVRADSFSYFRFSAIESCFPEAGWREEDVSLLLAGRSLGSLVCSTCGLKRWEYPTCAYIGWLKLEDVERLVKKLDLCRTLFEQPNRSMIEAANACRNEFLSAKSPESILNDAYSEVINRLQMCLKSKLSLLLVNDRTTGHIKDHQPIPS